MKYKAKTGDIISKELYEIIKSHDPIDEPVYEVGNWVKYSDRRLPVQIKGMPGTKEYDSENYSSWQKGFTFGGEHGSVIWGFQDEIKRLATPEEIESVTKKFPFIYDGLGKISDPEYVFIKTTENVYLNKESWREIGIRKGWL